jgi:hypothetical protein
MCYVAGMQRILVIGAALLLGGCVYNPYTGLWQPAGYYGYYGYGYRPYYPPPYSSPYYGYYGSQYDPQYSYSPPSSGYKGSPSIQNEPLPMQQGQPQEGQPPPPGGPTVLSPPRGG